MPREPGSAASVAMDGEAQPACRERRPGWPQRTSGDGAWATPTHARRRYQMHDRLKTVLGIAVRYARRKRQFYDFYPATARVAL